MGFSPQESSRTHQGHTTSRPGEVAAHDVGKWPGSSSVRTDSV